MEGRLKFCFVTYLNIFLAFCEPKLTHAIPIGTALYVFGDSGVDPGNNNWLATIVKANFRPYGRDFVGGKPTGRFTDGKLVTDILSGLIGLPDILPAFLDPEFRGPRILRGASFASSASGYADTTALSFSVLTLQQQVENFKLYRKKIVKIVGAESARLIISGAFFTISTGSDDFANNYFVNPLTRAQFTVTEFQDLLLLSLSKFILSIYKEGATYLAVLGLPPFGCLPSQITLHNLTGNACVDEFNDVAISFNQKTVSLLESLQPLVPGLKLAYINIYDKLRDIIKNPTKYGFEVVRKGCCGTGLLETALLCNPTSPVCPDPSKYVFWDSFHPTSKAYNIMAQDIFLQVARSLL